MSGFAGYEALPQRDLFKRKRRGGGDNTGGEQTAATEKAAEPAAAAAGITDTQQLAQQLESPTHHAQRCALPNMPAYRSAAVGEHKFECKLC